MKSYEYKKIETRSSTLSADQLEKEIKDFDALKGYLSKFKSFEKRLEVVRNFDDKYLFNLVRSPENWVSMLQLCDNHQIIFDLIVTDKVTLQEFYQSILLLNRSQKEDEDDKEIKKDSNLQFRYISCFSERQVKTFLENIDNIISVLSVCDLSIGQHLILLLELDGIIQKIQTVNHVVSINAHLMYDQYRLKLIDSNIVMKLQETLKKEEKIQFLKIIAKTMTDENVCFIEKRLKNINIKLDESEWAALSVCLMNDENQLLLKDYGNIDASLTKLPFEDRIRLIFWLSDENLQYLSSQNKTEKLVAIETIQQFEYFLEKWNKEGRDGIYQYVDMRARFLNDDLKKILVDEESLFWLRYSDFLETKDQSIFLKAFSEILEHIRWFARAEKRYNAADDCLKKAKCFPLEMKNNESPRRILDYPFSLRSFDDALAFKTIFYLCNEMFRSKYRFYTEVKKFWANDVSAKEKLFDDFDFETLTKFVEMSGLSAIEVINDLLLNDTKNSLITKIKYYGWLSEVDHRHLISNINSLSIFDAIISNMLKFSNHNAADYLIKVLGVTRIQALRSKADASLLGHFPSVSCGSLTQEELQALTLRQENRLGGVVSALSPFLIDHLINVVCSYDGMTMSFKLSAPPRPPKFSKPPEPPEPHKTIEAGSIVPLLQEVKSVETALISTVIEAKQSAMNFFPVVREKEKKSEDMTLSSLNQNDAEELFGLYVKYQQTKSGWSVKLFKMLLIFSSAAEAEGRDHPLEKIGCWMACLVALYFWGFPKEEAKHSAKITFYKKLYSMVDEGDAERVMDILQVNHESKEYDSLKLVAQLTSITKARLSRC